MWVNTFPFPLNPRHVERGSYRVLRPDPGPCSRASGSCGANETGRVAGTLPVVLRASGRGLALRFRRERAGCPALPSGDLWCCYFFIRLLLMPTRPTNPLPSRIIAEGMGTGATSIDAISPALKLRPCEVRPYIVSIKGYSGSLNPTALYAVLTVAEPMPVMLLSVS